MLGVAATLLAMQTPWIARQIALSFIASGIALTEGSLAEAFPQGWFPLGLLLQSPLS